MMASRCMGSEIRRRKAESVSAIDCVYVKGCAKVNDASVEKPMRDREGCRRKSRALVSFPFR